MLARERRQNIENYWKKDTLFLNPQLISVKIMTWGGNYKKKESKKTGKRALVQEKKELAQEKKNSLKKTR